MDRASMTLKGIEGSKLVVLKPLNSRKVPEMMLPTIAVLI